jgi:hypothetical protein
MNKESKVLRAAVKTTETGNENFLVSLHYMDIPAVKRFLAGKTLLLGRLQDVVE